MAKLRQPLEHGEVLLQLQPERHHQPHQRRHGVLGVRSDCGTPTGSRADVWGGVNRLCLCVLPQTQHAPAQQRPGGAGRAPLAPGGYAGPGLGPGLLLHLERSGVDRKGQSLQPILACL